jgi:hypothetical protein
VVDHAAVNQKQRALPVKARASFQYKTVQTMTTEQISTTFATLANCLEEAYAITCESQAQACQHVAFDSFISEDGRDGFQLLISDGCDGYEMLHQFTDSGNPILLFDEGRQALAIDDEGETVTLMILEKANFA